MAVRQVSNDKITKDGRRWYFYTRIYLDGKNKLYTSKCYSSRKEAMMAERDFITSVTKKEINLTTMTFQELYEEFFEYKKDKVKLSTIRIYEQNIRQLTEFLDLRIKDIKLDHYLAWRKRISALDLKDKTKNGYYKLLKAILNYGTKWHDFNFAPIYSKMEKFYNPNALPEEMKYYTWEEFKQFLSVIDDIKWKCVFEILYFCGLRKGELLGLTWDNIDFEYNQLSIVKNVIPTYTNGKGAYIITTPKTKSSSRTLPLPKRVMNDLILYYNQAKRQYGFNNSWFVFGDKEPLHRNTLRSAKIRFAKEANVKDIRLHDFRHSCASILINNGASIMVVAKYLGHTKIDETLNTYSHLFKNKLDEITKTMDLLE